MVVVVGFRCGWFQGGFLVEGSGNLRLSGTHVNNSTDTLQAHQSFIAGLRHGGYRIRSVQIRPLDAIKSRAGPMFELNI